MSTAVTVFRDLRPMGGPAVDLVVRDGVVAAGPAADGADVVDCRGLLALPSLVDAHIHPDKTSWGERWFSRRPVTTGIAGYAEQDVELSRGMDTPVAVRAGRLMAHAVARGTRAMRAHVDVAPPFGLDGVRGVAAARDELAHALTVQIVGFPQQGVYRAPGTAELLEEAAREGLIDLVGGIDPLGFDEASDAQLDLVFGLADRHGLGVDIHLHDTGEAGLLPLRGIIDRTRALGLQGQVTVSHAFCVPAADDVDRLADELAEAGISLTTVVPDVVRVLPVARLQRHGVRVGLGSDGVRDAWSPFGNADMLHRAHLLGLITRARVDEDLTACLVAAAHGGADVLGLPRADFTPGSPADFLLVDGECVPQVLVDLPPRALVVRAGRVIATGAPAPGAPGGRAGG
ncbi:amidohydrolase [Petropleomorpha daqingensis]|uniref:Cytosine/adenosine deaminase-related metal-dependent hydrolase n=1 Tax=Petropleomorpha daqingensis TaxID=2026353 RepID=A0A853CGT4_9ACTN|nr:amidohydrolase [Petropleomorpha daqingensis]NYJ07020.1 cytosine/adenosine deaminase-related metal-dependent hydrolase [Petropleomorpha daqingensis]